MFSIGEFASWTGLTVKALHHYDEVGLLPPARVDPSSRYRKYAPAQLRDGIVVRALRDAGVPVAEIATAVAAGSPAEVVGELVRAGNPPTGAHWNTLRTSGDPDAPAEVVLAWAVATPMPPGWGGPDVETGVLPARRLRSSTRPIRWGGGRAERRPSIGRSAAPRTGVPEWS